MQAHARLANRDEILQIYLLPSLADLVGSCFKLADHIVGDLPSGVGSPRFHNGLNKSQKVPECLPNITHRAHFFGC